MFLPGCWLRALVPQWLLVRASLSSSPRGPLHRTSQHGGWLPSELAPKTTAIVFLLPNLSSDIPSPLLSSVLRSCKIWPTLKGRESRNSGDARTPRPSGTILKSRLPTTVILHELSQRSKKEGTYPNVF